MGKRVPKTDTGAEALWQKRYRALQADIQNFYEETTLFQPEDDVPNECISVSEEFFISNDLHVVDNEAYALKHWGKGRYFRVVKADAQRETAK
jgi:hypothetical protein